MLNLAQTSERAKYVCKYECKYVCKCVSTYACANKHFAKFLWKSYKGFIMMKLFAKKTSSCGPFEMAVWL